MSYKDNETLLEAYRSGDSTATEQLLINNTGLIHKMASRYSYSGKSELEDLMQEGYIGLIKAIDKYDHSFNVPFGTYAAYWIKLYIYRYIQHNTTIRLPLYLRDKIVVLKEKKRTLTQQLGHEPTTQELARRLEMKEKDVVKLIILYQDTISLDELTTHDEEGDQKVIDTIKDDSPSIEEIAEKADNAVIIRKAMNEKLSDTEKEIIEQRYGFCGEIGTLDSIGNKLNITKNSVAHKERKALGKLSRCKSIMKLRLDELTFFYRRGNNPTLDAVLWREQKREQERTLKKAEDDIFYSWLLKLRAERALLVK